MSRIETYLLVVYVFMYMMCREVTEKYACELMNLSEVLLKAMSSTLGLDEDYLHRAFGGSDGMSASMRVNYYPKCPEPELTLGLSSHSDPGGITLLLLDENVKGTQVRRGNTWVMVEPVPDAFVVNVGDQIQVNNPTINLHLISTRDRSLYINTTVVASGI